MRALVSAAALLLTAAPAHADDEFEGASIVYAHGGSLYRADPRGKSRWLIDAVEDRHLVRNRYAGALDVKRLEMSAPKQITVVVTV